MLIASNMRDNSAKLYHAIQQLLMTVVQIPKDKVFVSIYESGSGDTTGAPVKHVTLCPTTPADLKSLTVTQLSNCILRQTLNFPHCRAAEWLLLLDHLLDRMEVPHKIITGLNGMDSCHHPHIVESIMTCHLRIFFQDAWQQGIAQSSSIWRPYRS